MILTHKTGIRNSDAVGRRLAQLAGARRSAWNRIWFLWTECRSHAMERGDKLPTIGEIAKIARKLKPGWWDKAEIDWEVFDAARQDLEFAYKRYLDCKPWSKAREQGKHNWHPPHTCGFPNQKKRGDRASVSNTSHIGDGKRLKWVDQRHPVIPGVGVITLAETLREPGWVKEVHCVREGGKWYAVLVYENGKEHPAAPYNLGHVVGVDVNCGDDFVVTSDGEFVENPRWYRGTQKKLRAVNKAIARSIKQNPNTRTKRREALYAHRARLQAKQKTQRGTYIRQVASAIAKSADTVVVETLNVIGMVKNPKLAKSLHDAGMGQFLKEMAWQCQKSGKTLLQVSQWYPSTQLCARCGGRPAENIGLGVRHYHCEYCGWDCHRDLNSALNLKKAAPALWAALKGHGETVSPAFGQAGVREVPMGDAETRQVRLIPA